jgi:hypothetical protein
MDARCVLTALGFGLLLAGCAGTPSTTPASPTPVPVTLTVTPSTVTVAAGVAATPVPVTVARSIGSFSSLGLSVANPTLVGVTPASVNGGTATFSIVPIASGNTFVTVADAGGAFNFVNVTNQACSTNATLLAVQQIVPAPGAVGVSPSIGTMYFVVYFALGAAQTGNLHLVVKPNGTLEGGALTPARPPPGTALPTPIPLPNATSVTMSATVPALPSGQQFQSQVYNNACQPAVLGSTFST